MRFRPTTIRLATYGAISLFNLYVILLYFAGDLTLYIHPRYISFTLIFNVLSLIACSTGFAVSAYRAVIVLSYKPADVSAGTTTGEPPGETSNETPPRPVDYVAAVFHLFGLGLTLGSRLPPPGEPALLRHRPPAGRQPERRHRNIR